MVSEMLVYNELINKMIHEKMMEFNKLPFYGIIPSADNKLRIRYSSKEDQKAAGDLRKKKRGRVAETYDLKDLIYFLWYSQTPVPIDVEINETLEDKISYLYQVGLITNDDPISNFDEARVNYYYYIKRRGISRSKLSEYLKQQLLKLNWVYQT